MYSSTINDVEVSLQNVLVILCLILNYVLQLSLHASSSKVDVFKAGVTFTNCLTIIRFSIQ